MGSAKADPPFSFAQIFFKRYDYSMSKTFVGILVMTKLKLAENSPEETVAVLQRRGKINTENEYGFKIQSFSGLCEITSYGKAEEKEKPEKALKREMKEELGPRAAKIISKSKPVKIYECVETDSDQVHIWTCRVDKNILKEIKLDISSGGIEILRKSDLDKVKFTTFADTGRQTKNLDEIIIFETPKEAIIKAFDLF